MPLAWGSDTKFTEESANLDGGGEGGDLNMGCKLKI